MKASREPAGPMKVSCSVIESLLIKTALLVIGIILVLWFGWPLPQKPELYPSSPHPSRSQVLPYNQSPRSTENSFSSQHVLKIKRDVGRAQTSQRPKISVFPPEPLDVNRGTSDELQTLPGIGPVLADRIVQHRESYGPYQNIEDLKNVRGIGKSRLARLRPFIVIKELAEKQSSES